MEKNEIKLKALADKTRLNIVKLLLKQKLCVKALAQRLELSQAAICQHLSVLFKAELLTKEKRGYFMHYNVNKDSIAALCNYFVKLLDTQKEICDKKECHGGYCSCKKP